MINIFSVLFYILGLTAGVTTVVIGIGSVEANIFTSVLAITVFLKLITSRSIFLKQNSSEKFLIGFYMFGLIANVASIFYQGSVWKKANISVSFTIVFGVLGLLLVFSEDDLKRWSKFFLNGLKVNCIVQIFWGIAQYLLCEFLHIAMNYQLGLLHSRVTVSPKFQVVGLGYERAQYCVLMIIGIIILKNSYLKVLAAMCIVLTQSRSGIIMLAITLVFMHSLKEWKKLMVPNSMKKLVFIFGLLIGAFVLRNWIASYFSEVQNSFITLDVDASGVKHMSYYSYFINTVRSMNPLNTFFGYGTATSGYPYTVLYGINDRGIAWNLESTWLANFWGYGLPGFICWFTWMTKSCATYFKQNKQIFSVFLAVLTGGLGYQLMPNFIITALIFLRASFQSEENKSGSTDKVSVILHDVHAMKEDFSY